MEFKTRTQKECYEKIVPWMKELFGAAFLRIREDVPALGVVVGTSYTQISVYPWGDDDTTITTRAYVVTKIELAQELLYYLLRENDTMRFGAFGIDHEDDIFFEHTIVGSTADIEELKSSVLAVVHAADQYDDEIRQKWGGERAVDRG
jgi:hypothetical protein